MACFCCTLMNNYNILIIMSVVFCKWEGKHFPFRCESIMKIVRYEVKVCDLIFFMYDL